MERRQFLGAAAALSTLPAVDATDSTADDASATRVCAICGGAKPAGMVDRTTVEAIAPLEADICRACQHVQTHELGTGRCMRCGAEGSSGFSIELEFPLGAVDRSGVLAGQLCGDCAGGIAGEINYEGVAADEEASERLRAIHEAETRLMNDVEESS